MCLLRSGVLQYTSLIIIKNIIIIYIYNNNNNNNKGFKEEMEKQSNAWTVHKECE
jgi:hypothetical protein